MQASLWEKESFYSPADVLIIGSGFVGLWTALELKKIQPTLDVLIVDRGIIPTGASTRNAGFSCFGSATELLYDLKTWGEEKTLRLVQMRYSGLQQIRKTFRESEIDYTQPGGYDLLTDEINYDIASLKDDLKKLNRSLKDIVGDNKTFSVSDEKIEQFGFKGVNHLIATAYEGQLHSGKLTQALLMEVQRLGVRVLFGYEVSSFEDVGGKIIVRNKQGIELSTKRLAICTNAFTRELIPQLEVEPARGQVLVTSEIRGLKLKGCFHYDEGFVYFRNLGNRLLLGGARNKFLDEERTHDLTTTSQNIQNALERLMKEVILPGQNSYTIEHRWSGIMGMRSEKHPALGELKPGVLYAVGLGGIGLATSPMVAKELTKMLL
ncbi:MAG TPA: FAD-dependent oxidoreductase [Chitinophagaceae bacterium]|nr:FAD-dependent oxidoreductase [Chitinophagaceae bacterium]